MTYTYLEQRMAKAYLAMLPAFVPDEQAGVGIAEQLEFYDLIKKLYQLLFDDPSLIIPTLHEDDAFPTRYKKEYGKPDLQVKMSKYNKAVNIKCTYICQYYHRTCYCSFINNQYLPARLLKIAVHWSVAIAPAV
jgi:hypothetical protein